jgi:Asp-tRNA(Asn)/Glu-tRNA(Gln) amidotransferase C subunit
MEIKSTKILQTLSIDSIFELDGKVISVVVMSAYMDTSFIEKIINYILEHGNKVNKPHFSIYLDYHASGYSSNQGVNTEVDKIVTILANYFDSKSGVYLVKTGYLFHSKCIISQSRTSINLLLGSINFTENGFTKNEELVLNGQALNGGNSYINQLVNQIWNYIENLSALKVGSDEIISKPLSLRQVLLTGEMYYEQKENDPFGFALNIPDSIRDIDQEISPLIGAKINNSISIEDIVNNIEELKKGLVAKLNSKASWKKFCIETCYGFWAPVNDRDNIEKVINKKLEVRYPYYSSLFKIIKLHKNTIEKQFVTVAEDIEKYVDQQKKIDAEGNLVTWSAEEAVVFWNDWYYRLEEKLESEEFCQRIIVGIIPASVPNVWSDKLSATEFEESFAKNLQYYCIKGKIASGKYAAKSFISKYGLQEGDIVKCNNIKDLVVILNTALRVGA